MWCKNVASARSLFRFVTIHAFVGQTDGHTDAHGSIPRVAVNRVNVPTTITSKWLKIDLYSLRRKCSPKNLFFSDISFMAIFAEVTENERIIDMHLRDIHPLFHCDASESRSMLSI